MYWSLHDNNILCSFIGHSDLITHLDLNPKDQTFLSCSKDGTTRVWDYQKKECLIKINKSKTSCFDNSGMIMACLFVRPKKDNQEGQLDQMIHLFKADNYKDKAFNTFMIEFEHREITTMKFSPNGKYILLATQQNLILLLDAFKGTIVRKFEAPINGNPCSNIRVESGFSPDSNYVMSGSTNSK
jgi:COMPASS component SWD2